jgi:hypothetical protein
MFYRHVFSYLLLTQASLSAQFAFCEDAVGPTMPLKETSQESKSSREFREFIADGTPVVLEHLSMSMVPPTGWIVQANAQNMSLVMSEPKPEEDPKKKVYDTPKYQRNITVSTIHNPSVIDEQRATELKTELQKSFGASTLVSDYQVLEHSFFDFRGSKDGLIVYASMTVGQFPMMQMNVLISGEEKQFLLTYTDLADRFRAQPDLMAQAWTSMTSISVNGQPSGRFDHLIVGGAATGFIAVLLGGLGLVRRRRQKALFSETDSDSDFDSDDSSWDLSAPSKARNLKPDQDEDEIPQVSVF